MFWKLQRISVQGTRWSVGWVDSWAHEIGHVLTNNIPFWKWVANSKDRFPLGKWLEESFAYSLGHLSTLRVHGVVGGPLEAMLKELTRAQRIKMLKQLGIGTGIGIGTWLTWRFYDRRR